MNIAASNTDFITKKELASRLKLHPNTIDSYESQGLIKGYRFGVVVRFDYFEVVNDLKNRNARVRLTR